MPDQSIIRNSIRTAILALVLQVVGGGAVAQTVDTGAITFDVDAGNNDAAEVLLIAAYVPEATSPILGDTRDRRRAAVLAGEGRPKPSIILGTIEAGNEAAFGIEGLLTSTVDLYGFDWDDLAAREALRKDNPEIFSKLVNGGHIDPPEDLLNAAIQTDLKRMNCYTSTIDGLWGPGSRRSVGRYYDTKKGDAWPDQEPSNGLFRDIILKGDVKCVVVAAPVKPRATTSRPSTTQRSTQPRQTTTRRATPAPKPAAEPAPAPARKPTRRTGGVGVFR